MEEENSLKILQKKHLKVSNIQVKLLDVAPETVSIVLFHYPK